MSSPTTGSAGPWAPKGWTTYCPLDGCPWSTYSPYATAGPGLRAMLGMPPEVAAAVLVSAAREACQQQLLTHLRAEHRLEDRQPIVSAAL